METSLSELAKKIKEEFNFLGVPVARTDSYWKMSLEDFPGEWMPREDIDVEYSGYKEQTNFRLNDMEPRVDQFQVPVKLDGVCYNLNKEDTGTDFVIVEYIEGNIVYHFDMHDNNPYLPSIAKTMRKLGVPPMDGEIRFPEAEDTYAIASLKKVDGRTLAKFYAPGGTVLMGDHADMDAAQYGIDTGPKYDGKTPVSGMGLVKVEFNFSGFDRARPK